jgi:hypothetical protein
MIHPPTITHGPLHPHEVAELADLTDDLAVWIEDLHDVPDHVAVRVRWWAYRLANTTRSEQR